MRKLYRSRTDRWIAGICGGLSKYLDIDVTVIRLLFVFLWIATGILPLSLGYLIAIIIIPLEPIGTNSNAPHRFYRSHDQKMMAGICGAIAESWDMDPTVIRLITVLLCFLTGILPLTIAYCMGWIILPEKSAS